MTSARFEDLSAFVLRLAGLGLAFFHGLGKVQALASGGGGRFIESVASMGFPLPAVFAWAAAASEFVGGLCVAFGIRTRVAAAFAAITMLVAAFGQHRTHWQVLHLLRVDTEPEAVRAAWGSPEKALLYAAIFIALVGLGGGRYSLDRLFGRKG